MAIQTDGPLLVCMQKDTTGHSHTGQSHTYIHMHTSHLMQDHLSIIVKCEAVLLTISPLYTPIAMDCPDTTGTCVTSYEYDLIN